MPDLSLQVLKTTQDIWKIPGNKSYLKKSDWKSTNWITLSFHDASTRLITLAMWIDVDRMSTCKKSQLLSGGHRNEDLTAYGTGAVTRDQWIPPQRNQWRNSVRNWNARSSRRRRGRSFKSNKRRRSLCHSQPAEHPSQSNTETFHCRPSSQAAVYKVHSRVIAVFFN